MGIVETVHLAEHVDRAESLTVLAGRFGRRLVIDGGQVAAIVPHEQQVFLKPGATIVGSEPANGPVS